MKDFFRRALGTQGLWLHPPNDDSRGKMFNYKLLRAKNRLLMQMKGLPVGKLVYTELQCFCFEILKLLREIMVKFTRLYGGLLPSTCWMEGSYRVGSLHGIKIWDFRRAFAIAARMSSSQTSTVSAHRIPQ